MGKYLSTLKNPFRNFNVESRAHKVISASKPTPAPKYEREQITYEQMLKDYPEAFEESLKKQKDLDERLKNVYVTSELRISPKNAFPKNEENPERPLPSNRHCVEDFEFGYPEPKSVPPGKTTLKIIAQFINNNQVKPSEYTAEKIAQDHLLSEDTVKKILKYYRVFEVYIPQERTSKAKFAGPAVKRIVIKQTPIKALPESKKDDT